MSHSTKNFSSDDGSFKRQVSSFRDSISSKPGARFPPEANRYHLYVSYACPWAHRALITRHLKGLTGIIGLSVVHWFLDDKGWRFINAEEKAQRHGANDEENGTEDHINGFERISQVYKKANPDYKDRCTVPVLWDKKNETIVNNESSEIIRMLNSEFNSIIPSEYAEIDLYPESLRTQIDELNGWVYDNINNGVYKSGFATKEEPYLKEVKKVFDHLDKVEEILSKKYTDDKKFDFLLGNQLTEADIRLFTTIVRFDPVYFHHFKCNLGMIRIKYPHIHKWLRLLYWKIPGFHETTNFDHIKKHYYKSHTGINPYQIVPIGPIPNILPL